MQAWKRWQDWVSLVVGVWVAISAWVLGTADETATLVTGLVIGIAVALVALWGLAMPATDIPKYVNIVLGILLFVAPWIFGFADVTNAAVSAWISGVLIVLLELTALPFARRARRAPA
jgi:hypothetical protein